MGKETALESILILCVTACLIPLVVHKLRGLKLPVPVAEIVTGIVLGKSGLNLIRMAPGIELLALLGFAYLMFLSGLELDFAFFKPAAGRNLFESPLGSGLIIFGFTLGLSLIFASALTRFGMIGSPWLLTLIFSTTSLGVVVPVLKDRALAGRPIGRAILLAALVADSATMLMIPVVLFLTAGRRDIQLIDLLLMVGFGCGYYMLTRTKTKRQFAQLVSDYSQTVVRAAFALLLILVALAEAAGMEIVLGAFLAGILYAVAVGSLREKILPKLEAVGYGFLIPIFFLTVGAKFDLQLTLRRESLLLLPLLLYIVYVVKLVPALLLARRHGLREAVAAGVLLSSRLSLIIALSYLALAEKLINETIHNAFILVAMVTCVVSPLLFVRLFPAEPGTRRSRAKLFDE